MSLPITAREFLVIAAGELHALHSVVKKSRIRTVINADNEAKKMIKLTCSCGSVFDTVATEAGVYAVRNILLPEETI